MGALGDVAGALAPAAQGISQGQLASAQTNLEQQHYQQALDLQKQAAQQAAKKIDLEKQRVDLEAQAQKRQAVGQVLNQMYDSYFDPTKATTDAQRAEQAAGRQVWSRAASRYANGDLDGAVAELNNADAFHAQNGTLQGAPPAPPTPAAQSSQGSGTSTPNTPAQPAQATAAQPDVTQILSGLIPGFGLLAQGAQAMPQQAQQAMQAAAAPAPAPGALAGAMAGAQGTAPTTAPQGAIAGAAAGAAPPDVTTMLSNLLGIAPQAAAQPAAAPAAPATPPAPGPQAGPNPPPGSVQTAHGTEVPAEIARKYAGTGVNPYELGHLSDLDSRDAELRAILKAPRDPNITDSNYNAMIADARQELKDNATDRNKTIADAQARIKEQDANAAANLRTLTQARTQQVIAAGHDAASRYAADQNLRAATARNQISRDQFDQRAQHEDYSSYLTANRAQVQALQNQARDSVQQARALLPFALKEQTTTATNAFRSGGGGINVGMPGLLNKLLPIALSGNFNIGDNVHVTQGIDVKMTPEMVKYLQAVGQSQDAAEQLGRFWEAKNFQDMRKVQGLDPATNAASESIVNRALANHNPQLFVDAFRNLVAKDGTKAQAYNLLQTWEQVHPGEALPAGVSWDAFNRGNAPLPRATAAPAAPPPLAPGTGFVSYGPGGTPPPAGTPGTTGVPGGFGLTPAERATRAIRGMLGLPP